MKIQNPFRSTLAFATLFTALQAQAAPLGTGFTYQGRLNDGGKPANGTYDFVFVLYDSATNSVPIFGGILNDDVQVTEGTFTTQVDFGTDLFNGQERWLGVGVRGGNETGDVTELLPRHQLSATPYAHFARRAAIAETVTSVPWSAVQNVPASLSDGVDNDTTYTAGPGLALAEGNELRVQYAGTGSASTVARSDHDHLGNAWVGSLSGAPGLSVYNTSPGSIGLLGKNDGFGTGFTPLGGAGVFGDSASNAGVAGFSSSGSGVLGRSLAATGESDAVKGMNASTTGRGVAGYALATTGANIGVLGQTDSSSGTGVRGFATAPTGTTFGGRFSNVSPGGFALHGTAANSGVAYFQISNRNNNETAVETRNDGMGITAKFTSGSSTNSLPVVQAVHLGHGDAVMATTGGMGTAGNFLALTDFTHNAAVIATGVGKTRGLKAVSTTGEALRAESAGTAIYAKSESGGNALVLDGGAIRVPGAGFNTPTTVFVHRCTSGNVVSAVGGNFITIIDHPLCNNNPNAILFVTPRINLDAYTGYYTYEDLAIAWDGDRKRWLILNASVGDELGDFDLNDTFNVMVVLP